MRVRVGRDDTPGDDVAARTPGTGAAKSPTWPLEHPALERPELVRLAGGVLMAHERLVLTAEGAAEVSGPFQLAVIPTLAPYVLPWFLGPFSERFPNVLLTVVERTTEEIVKSIGAMELDAGLLATPLDEPGLAEHPVFYDPFYAYAHPDCALLDTDEVHLSDLNRTDLWLLEDGHCFRDQMVHLCGVSQRTSLANIRFEAGAFETLRRLIDHSGGCTLVPETFAQTLDKTARRTQLRPFADPVPTREIGLVAHRSHWKTDILQAVADTLRDCAPRSLPREPDAVDVVPVVPRGR